jgi:CubicO group peptidase (beta-lactamase class C family)
MLVRYRAVSVTAIGLSLLLQAPKPAFGQELNRARLSTSLDSLVVQLRRSTKIPGLTILIAKGSEPIFAKGYGFANLDHEVPAEIETVYGIGSITKQFVAAALLRLAEEGRVRLDDPLSRYLPGFSVPAGTVTLHHLLSNTSGIRGGAALPGRNPDRIDYSRAELLQTLVELYRDRPPEFPPGEVWAYQSFNYLLLGLVIERVSGRTVWDYLQEHFFIPLGMSATGPCDPGRVVKHRATGYARTDSVPDGVIVAPFVSPTLALGATGLCSSAPDMLNWQRALVEHRALRAESYARMSRPGQLNDGRRTDYGYGVVLWNLEGRPIAFHTGGLPGYTAYLAYLPESDVTVVVLVNANSDIFTLGPAVVRAALGLSQPRELEATHEELAQYVGRYESGRLEVIVTEQDEHLSAEINGSDSFRFLFDPKLLKQGDREFAVEWEPQSRLTFRETGKRIDGAALRYGGRTVQLRRTN